jgi:hypothetical protein
MDGDLDAASFPAKEFLLEIEAEGIAGKNEKALEKGDSEMKAGLQDERLSLRGASQHAQRAGLHVNEAGGEEKDEQDRGKHPSPGHEWNYTRFPSPARRA